MSAMHHILYKETDLAFCLDATPPLIVYALLDRKHGDLFFANPVFKYTITQRKSSLMEIFKAAKDEIRSTNGNSRYPLEEKDERKQKWSQRYICDWARCNTELLTHRIWTELHILF